MKRTIPFCAHIFVMVVNDDFWTKRWFRTSFSSCDSGSMVTQQHSIESQIYLSSDFLSPSPHTLSAFICSEQVWYTHIWLWSAIWISSSVFVVTFFCPFFIIFHSSQRQSILLPVKWPCIFFTCISYVYIFSFCSVCVCFCYGFQFIASSVSLVSSHSSLRPFVHSCIIWTWSEMLIQIYLHSRLHITVFNRSIIHFGCMIPARNRAFSYAGGLLQRLNKCTAFFSFASIWVTMNIRSESRKRKLNGKGKINRAKSVNRYRLMQ